MRRPYAWLRHALIVARFACLSWFCNSFFRRGDDPDADSSLNLFSLDCFSLFQQVDLYAPQNCG
jgi:hypothetical protein